MLKRYAANLKSFSETELERVRRKSVCVVGCGGLGCFVCNALARFGVGSVTVIDGDIFSESNLNRQLFAWPDTLGKFKAEVCKEELAKINGDIAVNAVCEMLDGENASAILSGHDIVVDCLDNYLPRIILENACEKLGITFVHGAISGFFGQVAVVSPGDGIMKRLFSTWDGAAPEGNPVFTAQTVSAIQCAEAIKLLAGRDSYLAGQLLHINLQDGVFEVIRV